MVVSTLLLIACAARRAAVESGSPSEEPALSEPALSAPVLPSLRVHALAEQDLVVLLRAPSDRARLVNFWASWCAPCREELPMLSALAERRPDIDVVLVSVDEPRDEAEVERLVSSTRLRTFQLGPDPAAILARVVRDWPRAIPVTLVVDAQGQEVGRVVGAAGGGALGALLAEIPLAG